MIPAGMYPSVNYKIRILSTDTALQGNPTNHFTINEPPPVPMLSNLGDTICPVGALLNANNSGPCIGCSYQWQFNGSNIPNGTGSSTPIDSSGIYNVVTTNLCGVSISNVDTFWVMPVINITIPDSIIVCVAALPLQLNVASPAGGIYQGFGITSPNIFNGIFIGSYTIHYIIDDSFGCQFTSPAMQIVVNTCTGVSEISNINSVDIYPNPASTLLTIALRSIIKNVEVTILDVTGKIIYKTFDFGQHQIEVNTQDFAEGVYVVQIQAAEFTETRKLVIKK